MFSSFKRKNYILCEEVKTAVLTEILVALPETEEHGLPSPLCVNIWGFFQRHRSNFGSEITKVYWRYFFLHFMIFWGFADII